MTRLRTAETWLATHPHVRAFTVGFAVVVLTNVVIALGRSDRWFVDLCAFLILLAALDAAFALGRRHPKETPTDG